MKGHHDPGMRRRVLAPLLCGLIFAGWGCGGQVDTRPADWKYISTAIMQPSCATANCHSTLAQRSGVRLDQVNTGYDSLVGRNFVIPGNPDASELMSLLEGRGTRRMPPDFPLPAADIDLVARWIMEGANR